MDWKEEKEIRRMLRRLMEEEIEKEHFAGALIGYYEKHEFRNAETMGKYDLW